MSPTYHPRLIAEYGDAVVGCLLLHGGDATFRVSEGIVAAPWCRVL